MIHMSVSRIQASENSRPLPLTPVSALPKERPNNAPFSVFVGRLGSEVEHGERLVRAAEGAKGRDLGTGELLALQAGIYRYTEAIDLSSKLIDRMASGVRTVLQGQ